MERKLQKFIHSVWLPCCIGTEVTVGWLLGAGAVTVVAVDTGGIGELSM
jgi:hypothetical protein